MDIRTLLAMDCLSGDFNLSIPERLETISDEEIARVTDDLMSNLHSGRTRFGDISRLEAIERLGQQREESKRLFILPVWPTFAFAASIVLVLLGPLLFRTWLLNRRDTKKQAIGSVSEGRLPADTLMTLAVSSSKWVDAGVVASGPRVPTPAMQPLAVLAPVAVATNPIAIDYVVKRGDTLSTVSGRLWGSSKYWKFLWLANSDLIPDPDRLREGQHLVVPNRESIALYR